ncbi:dmX-like protein 2 isoform X2 [Panonychus citri]|uniref:dmX-like protein 2 isoform X2 n=1 Tax=Panonychus citri TaxID=50023 RepID=UPI002307FD2D|nr:dmX-like protein 2 isoform X2 [Panonychus citri]
MDQHQILTGAVNAGDNCYSVGSVEGVPFTAYSAGCNIVILASNFQRVQIIPGILHGNVQVGCIDCSTDVGKIAAAYGKKVYIFEPTPLLEQNSIHKLDYRWIQTASLETDCFVSVISWSLEGNKLLTGGTCIQVWHLINSSEDEIIHQDHNHHCDDVKSNNVNNNNNNIDNNRNDGIHINPDNIQSSNINGDELEQACWNCVWQCRTSSPVCFLRFSPDGSLFVSAGKTDRLVKVWYESAAKVDSTTTPLHSASAPNLESYHTTSRQSSSHPIDEINYSFIYIAHPRAVTGISWRKTSKYLSRGSVANMLVTSCRDNICRLWVQTLLPDDGLVNFSQIETLSNHAVPRNQTQRHRQKLLLRLKHMKAFSQFKKRQAAKTDDDSHLNEPIPTLPSTFSVHDFHSFAVCGTAITPGFHFHLAASINAETDIPLVPSLSPNDANGSCESKNYPNFVIHWLNNKEMVFTRAAEKLLQEISVKIMQTESAASGPSEGGESDTADVEGDFDLDNMDNDATITAEQSKKLRHKLCRQVQHKHKHKHKQQQQQQHTNKEGGKTHHHHHSTGDESSSEHLDSQQSRQSCHTLSSSASTTIDLNNLTNPSSTASISDLLDRRFEALLREWHSLSDLLFSIHPVDGSLLVWLVQWLDEACPGSFRQAQVNFSSRIPNAIPLGDAATMSHNLALYSPLTYLNLKATMAQSASVISNLDSKACSEDSTTNQSNSRWSKIDVENSLTPTVCMATKHSNGSLNLWSISFAEVTKFTQLMSISHVSRVCGHRFRVNDISCHPVLPLLLTTSHHNLPGGSTSLPKSMGSSVASSPSGTPSSSSCCPPLQGLPNSGFCSELILWKVDPVGPLSMSGGVTELARINSLETAAFANVAWLPTLLPSTTLGSISNSPSACFIASDGHQLRVYQAVIDARTLLSEISLSQRYSQQSETLSPNSDTTGSSDFCGYRASDLNQAFKIVSLQSTSRPGCILELDEITDATHDWQYTQMLHVFQDQLLRGEEMAFKCWNEKQGRENLGLVESSLGAVVDLRQNSVFREPFFLTVLEKDPDTGRSVLHMWKLIISSHSAADISSDRFAYVPDSHLVQDDSDIDQSSRSGSPVTEGATGGSGTGGGGGGGTHTGANGAGGRRHSKNQSFRQGQSYSPLQILTTKVCTQVLPIPEGVEILHATPAAGHLSSSNIYPACFAPYLICTACSDGTLRFWRCSVDDKNEDNIKYEWKEWEMLINLERSSAIEVPGLPLYVSCAYSGRIACAYKHGQSFSRPTSKDPNLRYININLAIYECESTGGSEWVLEDTISLKNIVVPQTDLNQEIDIEPLINTALRNRKTLDTIVHRLGVSHDEHHETNRSTNNIQRLLSVPSYTTMQSLKKIISEQGNQFTLTQKSIVQLDWVSTEDGSHILTVSVGDKISVFTPVSTDIAQANLQAMKTSSKTGAAPATRMLLKQVSSMAIPMTQVDDIRWMKLRTTHLKTADGLPPLPMQMSWVRDGILVVGMDNEMHIYTQWKSQGEISSKRPEMLSEVTDSRVLTEEGLLIHAQEASHLRLPSHTSLARSPSSSVLSGLPGGHSENRKHTQMPSKGTPTNTSTTILTSSTTTTTDGPPSIGKDSIKTSDESKNSYLSQLPDFGIFEASRLACPVLPQYHPKQLMELLAFGKISRVRAILSHLVKSLCSMDSLKNYLSSNQGQNYESTERPRTWTRSRTLSIAPPPTSPGAPSPLDAPENYFLSIPEEVQLDYTEITSIRPLPLFALIEAEDEKPKRPSTGDKANSPKETLFDDYDSLFNSANSKSTIDETLDELLGKSAFNFSGSKANKRPDPTDLKDFNAHQARLLTKLLTHSHLPGLSSLDQMHLLALADAVASFNPSKDSSVSANDSDYYGSLGSEVREGAPISADSLDDCGLRFLLAMRQHTYLLRCLPYAHRKLLQKQGLSTSDIVWAFHSETQEELAQLIPSVAKGNPKWNELREVGCGWWIRNNAVLRRLMEQVAKASFQAAQDPLDAALFYLAMKKKSLVWGLYRSIGDRKMTEFFQNNFNEDKWRRAALKNAYALLGKQRFTHAAAFFLLGGAIWDAIEVCLNKLEDMQLAMTIVRLYEGDIETVPSNLKRILYQEVLGCDSEGQNFDNAKAHPDPFLRSMSYWMLQDYSTSLITLLVPEAGEKHPKFSSTDEEKAEISITPSVFNFYLYLRNQPLIVRRHLAQTIKDKKVTMKDSKEALKETSEAITPFERRLYFITAHQHFLAGCPSLALEVLSRLPLKIANDDHANFLTKDRSIDTTSDTPEVIASGTLNDLPGDNLASNLFNNGNGKMATSNVADTSDAFDWGAPVSDLGKVNVNDFQIDITIDSGTDDDDEDGDDKGLEMKIQGSPTPETVETTSEMENGCENVKLDIMAQQLKFIACLKILMEELSTLATGFEVDGGRLRYHLYVWLEKSVIALKVVCNYRTFSMRGGEGGKPYGEHDSSPARASSMILEDMDLAQSELARDNHHQSTTEATGFGELKPTLHEVLLAENLDFEAKLQRAARRKEWLQGNEALLRTLLSYCSLHGAHGGGLASVRMELILLLQELQQERSQHQLLSPLPFPTTLPLLAASVACQKTVIADPIRHLHSVTNDILMELTEMKAPPLTLPLSYCEVFVLRDLGLSLSACVYQSLSNSDNLDLKNINIKEDLLGASVVCANSHLMAGNNTSKKSPHHIGGGGGNFTSSSSSTTATGSNDSTEPLHITTPPNKWPGVQSLRALLARDKDEDSPKLHTLLCESYVAIYLSQLVFALAACDSHVLYRLVGLEFNEQIWGFLFGGGAKKLIHVVTQSKSATTPTPQNSKDESQSTSIDLFNALSQQRMKLHMKILQQLNQDKPTPPQTPNIIKEDRTTYKEQFVPPSMSIISYLMSKPKLSDDYILIDYDSSESVQSEDEDMESFDDLDDNIFGTSVSGQISSHTLGLQETARNTKKQDLEQYAWSIMRFAVIKLARIHLAQFLQIAGVELRELPTTSPLIHTVFKILEMWTIYMKSYMESFEGPPSNFLPNNYVEANRQPGGPPIWKYKVLLETNNTPFRSHNAITKPMKRLWNYLVRQERVQDLFIRYIFTSGKPGSEYADYGSNQGDGTSSASDHHHHHHHGDPVRIVHKEQDNISAFCLNNTQSGYIAIATPKEVQELDISVLLEPVPWLEEEAEFDILNMLKVPESLSASNYLVVQHPADRLSSSPGGKALQSQPISVSNQPHPPKGTVLLKRHKTEGTRRLCSHPTLPYYLSGSQDGAVNLWEWKHQNPLASPRAPGTFAKVTKVAFNQIGNKFGVTDGDGNLSLWQVALCTSSTKPFFSMQVHSKHASDFTFLGSSSLIITAGQSTDHKNICMWDTLLPAKKSLVSSFSCHEHHGASVVLYAPLNQLLITGGKKGEVFIFDMRQRTQRNKFQAHDSAIKCMTLDPGEEFFVTGSADGDIKVWSLIPPQSIVNSYLGEHSRSTLFRNIGMGVSHLYVDNVGRLFSCGADGSLKMRQLPGHR